MEAHLSQTTGTLGYWTFFMPVLYDGLILSINANSRLPELRASRLGSQLFSGFGRAWRVLNQNGVDTTEIRMFWGLAGLSPQEY